MTESFVGQRSVRRHQSVYSVLAEWLAGQFMRWRCIRIHRMNGSVWGKRRSLLIAEAVRASD